METPTPDWLTPTVVDEQSPIIDYRSTIRDIALNDTIYESLFERTLERMSLGHPIKDVVDDDPREIDLARFTRWMMKDKERKTRMHEAQEIGAEILMGQVIPIADGTDNPMEDVKRSELRVGARFKIAASWSPKRYGKDSGMITSGGGGPITINIGQVESPYATRVAPPEVILTTIDVPTVEITDI